MSTKRTKRRTKQASRPRTPTGNARPSATKKRGRAPVGRPDGPLARKRRLRVRLVLLLMLAVNVAVGIVWRDWSVSLAVLILSVITAPLLVALLLRRRR